MRTINVDNHTIKINHNSIDYISDEYDITLALMTGNQYKIRLTYENRIIDVEVMSFYIELKHGNKYANLKHLYVPDSLQGFGIGKLCMAIFYNLMELNNISMFKIKFGGGSSSYSFLNHIGFNSKYIDTIENMGQQGTSVVVGNYESFGSDYHNKWKLDPIPISEYPTNFFS